jgi:hypothetical protein
LTAVQHHDNSNDITALALLRKVRQLSKKTTRFKLGLTNFGKTKKIVKSQNSNIKFERMILQPQEKHIFRNLDKTDFFDHA